MAVTTTSTSLSYPSTAYSPTRPADNTQSMIDLAKTIDSINSVFSNFTLIEDGLTAGAGGGQSNAVALNANMFVHRVNTVTTAADSVSLPAAVVGVKPHVIVNAAASNSMQVFGAGTDTINDVAAATGVAQAAGKTAVYFCTTAGKWYRILSA